MFTRVTVFAEAAYLLIIGLQYVVEPGDLSQFAQFQLRRLQSTGQLLLLWWVQLLQGGKTQAQVNKKQHIIQGTMEKNKLE